eukprot:m.137882 g.137882  ORF g.137882 m.137882 type:complete len:333 (-) comp24010_c0_seq1:143-1141(-)
MAQPRQTPLTCSGHTRPVVDLCYSPMTSAGFFLISACKDGKPMLRQGQTGDWLGTFEGHKGAVWGATLSKKAELAATAAADFTAKVWDAISGAELHSFSQPHIVKAVDFSADSQKLLSGCNDKCIRIYDLAKPDTDPMVLKGHTKNIQKTLWCPNGNQFISGGEDKVLRIWDCRSGKEEKAIPVSDSVTDMEISQDDKILTMTCGKTVSFWDLSTLEQLKTHDLPCPVETATLHPDRKTFVWGGADNYLHVLDYETGNQLEEYKGHFGPVHCCRFSPDGEIYASGSEDGTVRLWQTRVGTEYGLWRFSKPEEKKPEETSEETEPQEEQKTVE